MRRAGAAVAALLAGAALAQPQPGPVYMSVAETGDGRVRTTFVFSDGAAPGAFAPVAAYAVAPDAQSCRYDFAADPEIPEIDRRVPVLDPADASRTVVPAALPPVMADAALALADARGLAMDDTDRAGQLACVRRLWERIVGLRR